MTRRDVKALLLDDDENVLAILRHFLRERIPNIKVEVTCRPNMAAGYDIYLIDNDFDGRRVGFRLAMEAREQAPDALIIAYSSKLDRTLLKQLIYSSCDGAFDKDNPEELAEMLRLIEAFTAQRVWDAPTIDGSRISMLREMSELLRSWNSRLDEEEETRPEQEARLAG